jgi:hypothetical protein
MRHACEDRRSQTANRFHSGPVADAGPGGARGADGHQIVGDLVAVLPQRLLHLEQEPVNRHGPRRLRSVLDPDRPVRFPHDGSDVRGPQLGSQAAQWTFVGGLMHYRHPWRGAMHGFVRGTVRPPRALAGWCAPCSSDPAQRPRRRVLGGVWASQTLLRSTPALSALRISAAHTKELERHLGERASFQLQSAMRIMCPFTGTACSACACAWPAWLSSLSRDHAVRGRFFASGLMSPLHQACSGPAHEPLAHRSSKSCRYGRRNGRI